MGASKVPPVPTTDAARNVSSNGGSGFVVDLEMQLARAREEIVQLQATVQTLQRQLDHDANTGTTDPQPRNPSTPTIGAGDVERGVLSLSALGNPSTEVMTPLWWLRCENKAMPLPDLISAEHLLIACDDGRCDNFSVIPLCFIPRTDVMTAEFLQRCFI
jgi:hypothetical protein